MYPMWLKQVAERTAKAGACLEVVGHASPTGAVAINDRLSKARAELVKGTATGSQGPAAEAGCNRRRLARADNWHREG